MNSFTRLRLLLKINSAVGELQKTLSGKDASDMSKWLPSIISILTAAAAIMAQPLQHAVATHPTAAVVIGAIGAIISHFSPNPVDNPDPTKK